MTDLKTYIAVTKPGTNIQFSHYLAINRIESTNLTPMDTHWFIKCTNKQYRSLLGRPEIVTIEEDETCSTCSEQSLNGIFNDNWGLDRIDQRSPQLTNLYRFNRNGSTVDAYIIDTGIKINHNEFNGRATVLADFVNEPNVLTGQDGNGHGTHVAGIAAGNTYGVAKAAHIFSVKALNTAGSGSASAIIQAMNAVLAHHNAKINNRPSVVNMSLGFNGRNNAIDTAVSQLFNSGIIVVVAAGNSNRPAIEISPAGATEAFTVGAIGFGDNRSSFSNFTSDEIQDGDEGFGDEKISNIGSAVDVFAPGVAIRSSWPDETSSVFLRIDAPFESVIAVVPAGETILHTRFRVFTPYNGSSRIRVGTRSNPTLLFNGDPAFLSSVRDLSASPNILTAGEEIIIQYEQNNSTVGNFQATIDFSTKSGSERISGTSMAAPHAAGVAALFLEDKPRPTSSVGAQEVKDFIISNATVNTIPDLPIGTPNRVLFSFFVQTASFEWITPSGSIAIQNENTAFTKTVIAEFIDDIGTPGNVTYQTNLDFPAFLSLNASTGELTGILPEVTSNTVFEFTLTAISPDLNTIDRVFSINVLDVPNKPPVWVTPPNVIKVGITPHDPVEGEIVNFQLNAFDPEGQPITYTLQVGENPLNPGEIRTSGLFMDSNGLITGTVSNLLIDQIVTFTVRVSDGSLVTDRTFFFNLIAINNSPLWLPSIVVEPVEILTVSQGDTILYDFASLVNVDHAEDPDGDPLTFSLVSGTIPNGTTFTSDGKISGTIIGNGTFIFAVEVTDTVLSATRQFSIDVAEIVADQPPVWNTPFGNIATANELSLLIFQLNAVDPDGNLITYSLDLQPGEEFPNTLNISPSGLITGILPSIDTTSKVFTFTILASDGLLTTPRVFSITVSNIAGEVPPLWITPAGSLGIIEECYESFFGVEATSAAIIIDGGGEVDFELILQALTSITDLDDPLNDLPNEIIEVLADAGFVFDPLDKDITFVPPITYSFDLQPGEQFPPGLALNTNTGEISGEPFDVPTDTTFTFTIVADNTFFQEPRTFSITVLDVTEPETLGVVVPIMGEDRRILHDAALHLFIREQVNSIKTGEEIFVPFAVDFGFVPNIILKEEDLDDEDLQDLPFESMTNFDDAGFITGEIEGNTIFIPINPPERDSDFFTEFELFGENRPNFGIVRDPHIYMVNGLAKSSTPGSELEDFYLNLDEHHRKDTIVFGDFKYAIVRDNEGNHIYDAIYVEVRDRQGGAASIRSYPQAPGPVNAVDPIIDLFPPSLLNMRDGLIAANGLPGQELAPRWQKSEQIEGESSSIIGWNPGIVIAYSKPNTGIDLVKNVSPEIRKLVSNRPFTVDRYRVLSKATSTITTFDGGTPTTFDSNFTIFDSLQSQAIEETLVKFPPGDVPGIAAIGS